MQNLNFAQKIGLCSDSISGASLELTAGLVFQSLETRRIPPFPDSIFKVGTVLVCKGVKPTRLLAFAGSDLNRRVLGRVDP